MTKRVSDDASRSSVDEVEMEDAVERIADDNVANGVRGEMRTQIDGEAAPRGISSSVQEAPRRQK
jgi:hypothetical protein